MLMTYTNVIIVMYHILFSQSSMGGIYTVNIVSNVAIGANFLRTKYLCPSLIGQYRDIGSKHLKAFDS